MKLQCPTHPTFNGLTDIDGKCLDCAGIYVVLHKFQTDDDRSKLYEKNLKAEKEHYERSAK